MRHLFITGLFMALCAIALISIPVSAFAQKEKQPGDGIEMIQSDEKIEEKQHAEGIKEQPEKKEKKGSGIFSLGFKAHAIWYDTKGSIVDSKERFLPGAGYNPVFSIQLVKGWSISGSFLYGKVIADGNLDSTIMPMSTQTTSTIIFAIGKLNSQHARYDVDLLFNKKLADWVKIYFGLKYLRYESEWRENGFAGFLPNTTIPIQTKSLEPMNAPGLGFGFAFNVHLKEGLYLLPNVSLTVLYPVINTNGTLSLAYYFDKIRTTIEVGMKAQCFIYPLSSGSKKKSFDSSFRTGLPIRYDLFIGPYLGASYTF